MSAMKENLGCTWRVYPTSVNILADKIYHCPIEHCGRTFHNSSHMQMHITRHHKTAVPELHRTTCDTGDKDKRKHFYCPGRDCAYHQTPSEIANGARHFSSFRSLKQHYLKVHGERKFGCTTCEKSFATASYLRHHRLSCGQTFQCEQCSFSYGSREALLTHAKRKQHGYSKLISPRRKEKNISTGTQTMVIATEDRPTQTTATFSNCDSTGTNQNLSRPLEAFDRFRTPTGECSVGDGSSSAREQQASMYGPAHRNPMDVGNESAVVCTETQTDFMDIVYPNPISQHDPLLSYTHMYTQTCDEPGLFADLGLSTIETQTSWNDDDGGAGGGAGDGFGDYLVSTETQTNFDIDSFSSGSHSGDKIDQAVQCQSTPSLPYLQRGRVDEPSGTPFLSVKNDTITGAIRQALDI